MTRMSRLYVSGRRIAHNQWRILRKEGVRGNLASFLRFTERRGITGMFSSGLRARISTSLVRRWYRRNGKHVVVVAPARPDLSTWLENLQPGARFSLLIPVDSDLGAIRRELIQRFPASDMLFLDEASELPSADDIAALGYAAHRYETIEGRVGFVTPQLVESGTGERINGFEWDRVKRCWVKAVVRGADLDQASIPRYVLSAPRHGLYVRGDVLRSTPHTADGDLAEQLQEFVKAGWRRGTRTLAFPMVSLASAEVVLPDTTSGDLEWLTERHVRDVSGRLRIIYVLLATTISGGIRTVFEQTEHLFDLGHDVQIWSLDGPPDWTTSRTPIITFANHRDLTEALASEDAIKIATWWETAQLVWLASVNTGIAVYYVQEFETWFYPDDLVAQAAVAASYRLEMDHIAIAQYQSTELAAIGVPATVISSAYDNFKFYEKGSNRSDSAVMAVGRSFFQKNFAMTLAAWRSLPPQRPSLLLYGFEPEIARDPGVEYLLKPSDAQINDLYNRATLFVQTSRHEGFCLPVLEAMAAGCPVITTDSHGNRDFCFDGVNCVVVEQDDVVGLAAAIRRLLDDAKLRERLREAGLRTARDYTWQTVSRQLEARYLSLS